MALPITEVQQQMLLESIKKFVEKPRPDAVVFNPLKLIQLCPVRQERDVIAFPCNKAGPQDT